jgi:ATP-dependent RNA helicase DHX37/DHR1
MSRVMNDLQENTLSAEVMDEFISSKNMNIHLEKELKRLKLKEVKSNAYTQLASKAEESFREQKAQATLENSKKLVGNQISLGVNLFDVKKFKTEENFEHLKVEAAIPEEDPLVARLREAQEAEAEYSNMNPFAGTILQFLEGNAMKAIVEEVDLDRDQYLMQYMNVENDILVKINQSDQLSSKIKVKSIDRPGDILEVKQKLPVTLKEMEIMDSIINNMITIVCGETGSGKSTQIPQFVYEHGLTQQGIIGVTQPRRLAAISLAQRVSDEMASKLGDLVGYQVRFESSRFTSGTQIKFMTDGILLNEMMSDFLLTKYSVIVLDEAHERKINTDLLIGLLSRVIRIRAKMSLKERQESEPGKSSGFKYFPLRLVIMSATLRVTDFTENKFLFPDEKINVINVEARMFPVKTIHERETPSDYTDRCIEKTIQIHTKLPKGGILVFLTGEEEIKYFCREIEEKLHSMKQKREQMFYELNEEDFQEGDYELDLNEDFENQETKKLQTSKPNTKGPSSKKKEVITDYVVYPLYSKLPLPDQQKIFNHSKETVRLIVVATNVAETSLTIPGVKYVVDAGKEKKLVYNSQMTLGRFEIDWVSQSSAKQREGRAGRTCSGFCYRIYSMANFNKFKLFSDPEIVKEPLDSSILTLKTIGIQDVFKFPYVTRPAKPNIEAAEKELKKIGALNEEGSITKLGSSLSQLPIKPRIGKLLLMSRKAGELGFGILLSTVLSSEEIFDTKELKYKLSQIDMDELSDRESKKAKKELLTNHKKRYEKFLDEKSDLITESNIIGDFISMMMKEITTNYEDSINKKVYEYCKEKSLVFKTIRESYSLVLHLLTIVSLILTKEEEKTAIREFFYNFCPPKRDKQMIIVEIITASMIDRVARRVKYVEEDKEKEAFETMEHEIRVHIHPSSFLFSQRPQYLLYNEVIESTTNGKVFLARITQLEDPSLLAKYDETKGRMLEAITDPPPTYIAKRDAMMHFAKCTFGPKMWELNLFLTEYLEDCREKYVHFVYCLLQGKVFQAFKVLNSKLNFQLQEKMATEPKQLSNLITFFQKHRISSKKRFLAIEEKHPNSICEQVVQIVQPNFKNKTSSLWKKLINA